MRLLLAILLITGCTALSRFDRALTFQTDEPEEIEPEPKPEPTVDKVTSGQWKCCKNLCRAEPKSVLKQINYSEES